MSTLLVVHHTPSPAVQELLEAVLAGARDEMLEGLTVTTRPALSAGPADVLAASGVVLLTPANIGYMSGALKHFFDVVYYPCLQDTRGLPYGLAVHGNNDTAGAVRSVTTIAGGMGWRPVGAPVEVVGAPQQTHLASVGELAATVGAYALGMIEG